MLITTNKIKVNWALAALCVSPLLGCAASEPVSLQPAKLFANLPESCATPDAFAVAPDGTLTLSCPNFANNKLKGELLSISAKGEVSHLATVPTLGLKRKANPMGLDYDESGALYVADARGVKQGRVLKMTFNGKELVNTEVVASGLNPNGIRYYDGAIYVSQPMMPKVKSDKMTSGIYRFKLSDRNLKLTNTLKDSQLIFTDVTNHPDIQFGLDGLAFDKAGNLYTTDLGDGEVFKLSLNKEGKVTQQQLFSQLPPESRGDGMVFDTQDNLYIAGLAFNQIFKIDNQGVVTTIADYPDNDGTDGQLDQPVDVMVYRDKLIISNFDLMKGPGFRNSQHDKPYTLSYIELN